MDSKQYKNFKQIAYKICGGDERTEDLLHDVLFQLNKNKVYNTLSEKDQVFFFVRTISNQYRSNNSLFRRTYRKYQFEQLNPNIELVDEAYQERPTMDWIREMLETELEVNPSFWYNKGIFELWIENKGFIERIHKQTKIPRYSIIDTINEVKKLIHQRWKTYNDGREN